MNPGLRRWVLVVALLLTAACAEDDGSIARVGHRPIEIESFQQFVQEVTGEPWQRANERVASALFDQFLDQQVVFESAARKHGRSMSASNRGPAEIRWLIEEMCGSPPDPDPAEVDAEVARRLELPRPARAHVRQLLIDDLGVARDARRRLMAGEDFVELSREVSRAPNAGGGGELGFIDQGHLPSEFDDVIFKLAPGEISEPIEGPSGYHVFQVLEKVPAGVVDREAVEAAVRREVAERTAREHTHACILRLADEVGVRVNRERLWFPYKGKYAEGSDEA